MMKNQNSPSGIFITFEGGEGSGKTLQSKLLFKALSESYDVVLTREPGGTPGAEAIRNLLLTGSEDRWHKDTELLLYLAARSEHWHRKIKPALEAGKIIISDRFQDSSIVYQGYGKNIDLNIMSAIYNYVTGGITPDRTYLITIDPVIGLDRSLSREGNTETRFENMDMLFHKKVLDSFLKIYEENMERIIRIEGNDSIENISKTIISDAENLIKSKEYEKGLVKLN